MVPQVLFLVSRYAENIIPGIAHMLNPRNQTCMHDTVFEVPVDTHLLHASQHVNMEWKLRCLKLLKNSNRQ